MASEQREEVHFGRLVARWIGVVTALGFVPFAIACVLAPVSAWGLAYLAATTAVIAGLITAPNRIRRMRGVTRIALLALVAIVVARIGFAAGGENLQMITLPGDGRRSAVINRIIEEEDGVVLGAQWLPRLGVVDADEAAEWAPAMKRAYEQMSDEEGTTPSPVVATYLGMQDPEGFDALVLEPDNESPNGGIVFLHGYAGSFTSLCWMATRGARRAGLVAICPSASARGDWWDRRWEPTIETSIAYLRGRGIRRIYLGGLSNGSIGAARIAPRMARQLAGLILISGVPDDADTGGLPTLILQGRDDRMTPPGPARALVARGRPRPTYVEFPGTHFLLAEKFEEVNASIASWLRAH